MGADRNTLKKPKHGWKIMLGGDDRLLYLAFGPLRFRMLKP